MIAQIESISDAALAFACFDARGRPALRRSKGRAALLLGVLLGSAATMPVLAEQSAPSQSDTAAEMAANSELQEVVVTATRREESISRVPINITALSTEKMDSQGIRSLDDIARLTPDLTFRNLPGPNGGSDTIAIRGIFSTAGAPTTGVYIDETPVQPRALLYTSTNATPVVFDLERVEVLRGPQGTLFGAGAEGGALRFLTPRPDLERYGGYVRSDVMMTESGAPGYELGAAVGGPLVKDVLGFRISAYDRRDGGWIDRVSPDTGEVVDKNSNDQVTTAFKALLTWKPISELSITPSIYYQKVSQHDVSQIWENTSNPEDGVFTTQFRVGGPTSDRYTLSSLNVNYDAGAFQLISNTSYFDRTQASTYDYTNYVSNVVSGDPFQYDAGDKPSPQPGGNKQENWTQELRAQSNRPAMGMVDWTFGLFYSRNEQSAFLDNVTGSAALADRYGGVGALIDGIYGSTIDANTREKQVAGFANLDIHLTPKLKLQLGARVSRNSLSYNQSSDGPINRGYSAYSGSTKETAKTPKFGLSYQADQNTLVYASAGKGYRTGGAQQPVSGINCEADLAALGLQSSPTSYNSDSLWSYEIGAKSHLFDGKLTVDASAYLVKWDNIQQLVTLPTCGYTYVANLGSATSRGFDLSTTMLVMRGLTVGLAVGYVDVEADETVRTSPDTILIEKGEAFGGPPWVATVSGNYEFPITGEFAGYGRFDYTYRSQSPSRSAADFSYDPDIAGEAENSFATIRLGVKYRKVDAALFVRNLTNEVKILDRSHDWVGSPLFYSTTYRPRTIGLTVSARF